MAGPDDIVGAINAIIPPGCGDSICGTFDFNALLLSANNDSLFTETIDPVGNFWDPGNPITGALNPFLPANYAGIFTGPPLINSSLNTPGIPIDILNTGLYTWKLQYVDGGTFIQVTPQPVVLIPNTYILEITSTTELSLVTGNNCVYNLIFVINGGNNFNPIGGAYNAWCDTWGCTNPSAVNYDPVVNANNGSCDYDSDDDIPGCTDAGSCNYNPAANIDDGSCFYTCFGCTDNTALNWVPQATLPCTGIYVLCDNNSGQNNCCCEYIDGQIEGCTDMYAVNYDATASLEDGSCEYNYIGCTEASADNFNPNATIPCDGSNDATQPCVSIINTSLSSGQTPANATGPNCCCEIYGCTDPNGSNYDPYATYGGQSDDACVYDACHYGCTDPTSTNFDILATCDDGSCYGGCCSRNNEGEFVLTGWTSSRLTDVSVVGIQGQDANNNYYPINNRSMDPDSGKPNGWTSVQQGLYTAYTINNIHYWDYPTQVGGDEEGQWVTPVSTITKFAVQMKNCCPSCLYPDIKEEWSLGHVFPPQIKNNVFIERGIISVFEEHYRLNEVKRVEDMEGYQGGFFNTIT